MGPWGHLALDEDGHPWGGLESEEPPAWEWETRTPETVDFEGFFGATPPIEEL